MIHSSYYRPRIYPFGADIDSSEIDRLQDLSATTTLNRTKIEEIGRDGIVSWRTVAPTVNLNMRQLEYGSLEFWRKLASKGDSVSQINFTDFKTSRFDIAGYKTDDSGTFLGTIWYPGQRVSSFTVNVASPDALIERSFTTVGEDEIVLENNNKYLVSNKQTISAGNNSTLTINNPTPVLDPDISGQFLHRVVRIRSGTATVLTPGQEWSYNGSGTLLINGASSAGDVIRYWYSAGSYLTGLNPFTNNDTDAAGIAADACSLYLQSSNYLYRLQSASLEVTMDRFDIEEIGNKDKVAFGTRNISARVTLGRIIEAYTIEEVLRGKAGLSYGKLDIRKMSTGFNFIMKVYNDNTKTSFKLGYKVTDLAPVGTSAGTPTSDYIQRGATLEGEVGFISSIEAVL